MRLTLAPTLFTIPALIVLLALGTWQVYRLQWKGVITQDINIKISQPATMLPKITDLAEWRYRKVLLTGTFLHEAEIHLFTGEQVFKGEAGYNIFTPLKLQDGRVVFVDRGWIPASKKKPETRPDSQPKGLVHIEGLVMQGESSHWFTPANDFQDNIWFWVDITSMANLSGLSSESYYVRVIGVPKPDILPVPGDVKITIRNDHLQYAITWYSLAFILVVIYFLYHQKQK